MLLIYFTPSIHFSCLIFIIVSPRATTKTHIFHMFSFSSTLYLKLLIAFFKKYSFFIWFFLTHRYCSTITVKSRENDHQYTMCFFFTWCHFVYLECFWKKRKKKGKKKKHTKKKTRVNANMQLCLFIPIGMIKCWFGMVHKQFRWHATQK